MFGLVGLEEKSKRPLKLRKSQSTYKTDPKSLVPERNLKAAAFHFIGTWTKLTPLFKDDAKYWKQVTYESHCQYRVPMKLESETRSTNLHKNYNTLRPHQAIAYLTPYAYYSQLT
jgi:hypothetical protein